MSSMESLVAIQKVLVCHQLELVVLVGTTMDIIWLFICVGWPGCMDIGTKNAVPGATVAFG